MAPSSYFELAISRNLGSGIKPSRLGILIHNGSAASLLEVVNFYDKRFGIGFTDAQKTDLAAFLQTL
jgi:hypothetical protein